MKKVAIFMIVLFGVFVSLSASEQSDLEKASLFGNVKTVTTTTYIPKESFGKWVLGEAEEKTFNAYNLEGNCIEYITYNNEGNIGLKTLYNYDELGRLKEETSYRSNGTLPFLKDVYAYDDEGNKTETKIFIDTGVVFSETVTTYDYMGNITSLTTYYDESIGTQYLFVYNQSGNMTEEVFYDEDGSVVIKTLFTYDESGNKAEKARYKGDGTLEFKQQYFYNPDGFLTKSISSDDKSSNKFKTLYGYNDLGKLIKEDKYEVENSLLLFYNTYGYDNMGNQTSNAFYLSDGSKALENITSYEYDRNTNWIKRTRSKEVTKFGKTYLEPQKITIREITYY